MNPDQFLATTWYHGTEFSKFSGWQVPPPPVPGQQLRVPHTGVFFTTDKAFAQGVGPNLCSVTLNPGAKVLDATERSIATDNLRKEVAKHPYAQTCTHLSDLQTWVDAWKTGAVLRFETDHPLIAIVLAKNAAQYKGIPQQAAMRIAIHNLTRGWIELIVTAAKKLGFDALFGHEIDRHSGVTPPQAVPWLAVMTNTAISAPVWV